MSTCSYDRMRTRMNRNLISACDTLNIRELQSEFPAASKITLLQKQAVFSKMFQGASVDIALYTWLNLNRNLFMYNHGSTMRVVFTMSRILFRLWEIEKTFKYFIFLTEINPSSRDYSFHLFNVQGDLWHYWPDRCCKKVCQADVNIFQRGRFIHSLMNE